MARSIPFSRGTVAAIVVARGMSPELRSLLDALATQSRVVDHLIVCDVRAPRTSPLASGQVVVAEDLPENALLISVGRARNISDALAKATKDHAASQVMTASDWLWILHDDCLPANTCLEEQLAATEAGASIAAVTPKVFRADGTLAEVGIHATASGRRVPLVLDGEIDQGQYDGVTDVLAGGSAGLLVASSAFNQVGGFDRALGPYNEGLELCWRLHRAGHRVVAAPKAHLTHLQVSSPQNLRRASALRARRSSEFYFATLIANPLLLIVQALVSLIWIPLSCLALLLSARPRAAYARFFAWLGLFAHIPHILAARARHARSASQPRSSLRPLLTGRFDASRIRRTHRSAHVIEEQTSWQDLLIERRSSDLTPRVVTTLALFLLSLWIYRSDLGSINGGAWLNLPDRFTDLWTYAWSGWLPSGDGSAHAVDPLVQLLSVLSAPLALFGIAPTVLLYVFLVLTPAWAAWNMDVLSMRLTSSRSLRVALMCLWASLPSALFAMTSGRLASLAVHVFMPLWVALLLSLPRDRHVIVHRRWTCVAIVGLIITAAYPLLGICALVLFSRSLSRATAALPGLLLCLPFFVDAILWRAWPALLAPAEAAASYERASFGLGAWGMPAASSAAWLGVCALLLLSLWLATLLSVGRFLLHSRGSSFFPVSLPALVGIALVSGIGALALSYVPVDSANSPVFAWGGPLLSVQALALICALLLCVKDVEKEGKITRTGWKLVACVGLIPFLSMAVSPWFEVLPSAQWSARSASEQVPLVSRYAQNSSRQARVLVLNVGADGDLDARIWRGAGPQWSEHSSVASWVALHDRMNNTSDPARSELGETIATLVSFPDDSASQRLALHGVDTIIVHSGGPAASSITQTLDRAPGIEKIGETEAGSAWRVRPDGRKPARLCFASESADSQCEELASGAIGARTHVSGPGVLRLAERQNSHWVATLNGQRLDQTEATNQWGTAFSLPSEGELVLNYRSNWVLAWKAACALTAAVMLCGLLRGRKDVVDDGE